MIAILATNKNPWKKKHCGPLHWGPLGFQRKRAAVGEGGGEGGDRGGGGPGGADGNAGGRWQHGRAQRWT